MFLADSFDTPCSFGLVTDEQLSSQSRHSPILGFGDTADCICITRMLKIWRAESFWH
jgi:hypothetical protein